MTIHYMLECLAADTSKRYWPAELFSNRGNTKDDVESLHITPCISPCPKSGQLTLGVRNIY